MLYNIVGMRRAFYILAIFLFLPACGTKGESVTAPADDKKSTNTEALNESLMEALKRCDQDAVKKLILKGADVNARNESGGALLHWVAWRNNKEAASILLQEGADINARDSEGKTPLHHAIRAEFGETEMVKFLVEAGADVNIKDNNGQTPLDWAFVWQPCDILLKHGAKSGEPYRFELFTAITHGRVEEVKKLLDKGANPNTKGLYGETPLSLTARPVNQTYAGGGFSKDAGERLVAIAKLLIEKGADTEGKTGLLFSAASCGNKAVAEFLVGLGADIRGRAKDGRTPLHTAADHGNRETVEYFLSVGADVMARDEYGNTPLHAAVSSGITETVELLISKGAEVNVVGQNGMTPLHLAAREYSKENVELLIKSGAEVDKRDNDGRTPLHWAAEESHIAFFEGGSIKTLLDAGADINAVDTLGNTPLHRAVGSRSKEAVRFLISRGADASIANKEGKLPKDLTDDREMKELLRRKPEKKKE